MRSFAIRSVPAVSQFSVKATWYHRPGVIGVAETAPPA
jgi:hypothetical protein